LVGTAPLVSESPTARTLKTHLSCGGHTAHVSAPEVTLQMLNNSNKVTAVGTPSCRILRFEGWLNMQTNRSDVRFGFTIAQLRCRLTTKYAP
jgi:hypothetical protein